jgi:hypothetical protein
MSKTFERYMSLFFFVAVAIIALASRWLPHPPNFTAISGFFFVSGVLAARNKWFLLAAFVPLIISDALLGGYPGILFVYAGHAAVILFGWYYSAAMKTQSISRKALPFFVYNLSSAFIFFVLSNLGTWWSSGIYSRTAAGLIECFVMALPFFHQTAISQLIFSSIFVAGYFWLSAKVLASPLQQQS